MDRSNQSIGVVVDPMDSDAAPSTKNSGSMTDGMDIRMLSMIISISSVPFLHAEQSGTLWNTLIISLFHF